MKLVGPGASVSMFLSLELSNELIEGYKIVLISDALCHFNMETLFHFANICSKNESSKNSTTGTRECWPESSGRTDGHGGVQELLMS